MNEEDKLKRTEKWGEGPWLNEPDELAWDDPETGLPCYITRHPNQGHLCGYVGVPVTHPAHSITHNGTDPVNEKKYRKVLKAMMQAASSDLKDFDHSKLPPNETIPGIGDLMRKEIRAHGGLTYSGPAFWCESKTKVHWWFGFDCGHALDLSPGIQTITTQAKRILSNNLFNALAEFESKYPEMKRTYRNVDYVRQECTQLAKQLDKIDKKSRVQLETTNERKQSSPTQSRKQTTNK